MNEEPGKKSPTLALMLAFAPTAMVLAVVGVSLVAARFKLNLPNFAALAVLLCVGSLLCCFASSFMLFRRKTGLAVFGGILFLLLNGFIAFFFGCAALLSNAKF